MKLSKKSFNYRNLDRIFRLILPIYWKKICLKVYVEQFKKFHDKKYLQMQCNNWRLHCIESYSWNNILNQLFLEKIFILINWEWFGILHASQRKHTPKLYCYEIIFHISVLTRSFWSHSYFGAPIYLILIVRAAV